MFGLSEVLDLSSDDAALKKFVTREPISIFSQIKNVKDEEKKEKLNLLLEALRKKLPEGFKIGAAVGEGDCFFDSVAQGLNELKDKGLITSSRGFSVKSLRESCKQYAQQVSQSKKSSWLDNALKGEGEKLCEYIPRIEFTAEDIEGANSDSEIKVLKLENAIWGRSEIEGKMICEKYSVKIRIIELRDEEIDGVHVTKGKVGTGNNIIYIVNYRNHFVPLLSSLEKDIEKTIEVSREEAYGNAIGSSSNNISQSYISIPLRDIENSSHKQSSHSRSSGKENREIGASSRKRKRSVTDKDSKVPKRARMDVNVTSNEDSEFPSNLQDESRQDESHNTYQINRCFPHQLIGLMYQLDLSVLCLLRESIYKHKYPSLSLAFGDSEIDRFSNIVLRYEKKSIHIRIENVDKYYIDNDINYARLFTKGKQGSSINNYFNNFVKHQISKLDSSSNNIEYLVIYTNAGLGLTEEKKLKKGQSRNFYPFKFDNMNIEECGILKDFLFTNDNTQGRGFYNFSQNKTTRGELLKRLEFSPAMQKVIKEREFSQECEREIKEAFLDKLIFAVNQSNREKLNSIVKSEIAKNSKVQADYMTLQERVLRNLTTPEKHKNLGNHIPGITYEFNLLMLFLHDMFLHKNIFSINFKEKSHNISNDIIINSTDGITYVKVHNADSNIDYNQLFPSRQQKNTFSINRYFTLFVEELKNDTEHFIIYTNSDLDLTEEKKLKKGDLIKFDNIDIQKERYEILKDCLCIKKNGLYQFSQEGITRKKLLSLLKLPPALQKKLSNENEKEIKGKFLDKLIFAVNQPNREELNSVAKNEIGKFNPPYSYKELHEIALRWSESHELAPITERIMKKLLEDIKNNRSSYQKTQNKHNNEERQFARSVVGGEGTSAFNQFLDFLTKEEGIKYLEILKRKGINPANVSSMLSRAGANAAKAFKDLYDLWFDKEGNKTRYLKTLEKEGVNLANVSSILSRAGANAAKAFKDLYDLWFDKEGNKTRYLKTLEKEGVNLANVSSILSRAGANAAKAFKDLYDLWFDKEGNKTRYLKTLEKEGVNLANISNILHEVRTNAVKAFKDLYDLWFDKEGNKTRYLKTLEKEGVNLANVSSILSRAGANAVKAFKDLYDLWFDKEGNKTRYLKTLEKEGVNLANVSSILSRAGANAVKAFKDLYNLWFDKEGNKIRYLKTLEKEGVNLTNISGILSGAGANAVKAFKDLYDLWFDKEGNKTRYLKTLEKEGINLTNMSSILNGTGANAAKALKDLYDLWFDKEGNKTRYLKTLEEKGINLTNMSSILSRAGANAAKAFKSLCDLWFDKEGNKTLYLKALEREGVNLTNVSSILNGAGANATKAFKSLYDLWFDKEGNKTRYLKTLEEKGINLTNMSSILSRAGANAAKAFKDLYDLWFDKEGNKTRYLKTLEEKGINLTNMSSILHGVGINAARAFKGLYGLWFDEEGNKTRYLKTLEEKEINLTNISGILSGAGANAAKAFKDLYDLWFDKEGNKTGYLKTLEEKGINLANMSSILNGARANAAKAFKDLYDLWFDEEGNKTRYLKTLEEEEISLANMSSILNGAGTNAAKSFKDLYDLWFDKEGNKTRYLKTLEEKGVNLVNISSILNGAGTNAAKAFKELYNIFFDEQGNKTQHLKHFIKKIGGEKSFTVHNLSGILSGAGANVKDAFEKLHNVCFNDKGKRTKLLDDFYNADFEPGNLSCMLCGAGARASSILKRLHSVCFNDEGERTELLNDFYNADFRPSDLCSILSGAADSLQKFHSFCFIGKTKNYLYHFLDEKESFTLSNLCNMLHGARANICSALKDFHNVCFDEAGNKTQLLDDFHRVGFTTSNLSKILTMAGNNAASILRNFHKSCFNKENYLNHFLTEEELFTPKGLSKILYGVGTNICPAFKKLHDLCFDNAGNKTDYLNNLIKNNQSNEIFNILYKRVRKTPSTFLDEQNTSKGNKTANVGLESSNSSSRTEQADSSQQSDSKKNRKGTTDRSKNRQDDKILDTAAGGSRDLSTRQRTRKKQIQSVYHNKKEQLRLSKFVSSIEPVRQGLYLPLFEERGVEVDGRCVAITRGLSHVLSLHGDKSFLSNLETSVKIYERMAQGKLISEREEREVFAFSRLLNNFERQVDSATNSLPSNLVHTENYKILEDLSHYIAGIEGNFAIHLVTSNHVVAIYRTGDNHAYFDSNAAFVSGFKSVDQFMQVVEKAIKFAGYKVEEKGFLVEHFDVDKANNLLSDEDRQVLTREIKTERQLLEEQDKKLGRIKINDQEISRVQLYDFGTKIDVEGSVPLLINADMNLSSKKFQDHLDKKEVSMTAREYLDHLKNSENAEEAVQATKVIPFIGSKREIEEAEQTRKPRRSLSEQLVKGAINFIANNLTTVFLANRSEIQLSEKTDNKPETYLNDPKVDSQLQRSL